MSPARDDDDNVVRPDIWQAPTQEDVGGGNGNGPPHMNGDRLTRIEGRLGVIEAEQRTHLRWAMAIAIGLASLFIAGFGLIMSRIDRTEDKISRVDERVGRIESTVAELPGKITQSLMQLNQTLLQAITAASGQKPPEVIVIPQPQPSSQRQKK